MYELGKGRGGLFLFFCIGRWERYEMAEIIKKVTGFNTVIDKDEIRRYMGMGKSSIDGALLELADKCYESFLPIIDARACYLELDVKITEIDDGLHNVSVGDISVDSDDLARVLMGCKRAVLIAATIGTGADLIVKRASVGSNSEALIYNSIGTAAIEAYMAQLMLMLSKEYKDFSLRPRFSAGYGDLPLYVQKDIMRILDCNRKIGVTLSDSYLMTPSKSVTAFVGISDKGCSHMEKDCGRCPDTGCEYRLT